MIKYFFDGTKKEFQLYIGKNAGWHIYFNDIAQENGTYINIVLDLVLFVLVGGAK